MNHTEYVSQGRLACIRPRIQEEGRVTRQTIEAIFIDQGIELSPKDTEEIWLALERVRAVPPHAQTLRTFQAYLQIDRLRQALARHCNVGDTSILMTEAQELGGNA